MNDHIYHEIASNLAETINKDLGYESYSRIRLS